MYGNYTFVNPVLAKHYGMPGVDRATPNTWVRVDDADRYGRGGLLPMAVFPDAELAGPADQSGEARLLGGAAGAGRGDSAAAAGGAGIADRRSEIGSARARHAGATSREPGLRLVPCALRLLRPGVRRLRPGGRCPDEGSGGPARRYARCTFPGGSQGTGLKALQTYIREHRQNRFLDNFSRKLLAYALNRSLLLSDEPLVERMKPSWRPTVSLQFAGRDHRHQPAVSEPARFRNAPETSVPQL